MNDRPAKGKNRPAAPPSPWAKRVHGKLKRLIGHRIEALERQTRERQGPKPWRGKKPKSVAGRP